MVTLSQFIQELKSITETEPNWDQIEVVVLDDSGDSFTPTISFQAGSDGVKRITIL